MSPQALNFQAFLISNSLTKRLIRDFDTCMIAKLSQILALSLTSSDAGRLYGPEMMIALTSYFLI